MKKSLLSILIISVLLVACNGKKTSKTEAVPVNLSEVTTKAPELMGKLISLEGMVAHVCHESGKRLFLGEDSFKVLASNKIPKFDIAMEGSDVVVTGYLKEDKIDETYLASWEKELKEGIEVQQKEETHTYDAESKGLDESALTTQFDQIKSYRDQISAGGKGYISFYSLEVESITEKK
ncbi:MAG: hypothetical protein PHY99_01185 [Bacteroidales bacterium]|nr:hypothetical protein [Bacteroidales bacterium]